MSVFLFYCRKKGMTKFITDAVEMRLRMNAPYIDTWAQVIL